jgi:hypothetical protein
MGPIFCSESSVKNSHSTLRVTAEERRAHQHRGGGLKLRLSRVMFSTILRETFA